MDRIREVSYRRREYFHGLDPTIDSEFHDRSQAVRSQSEYLDSCPFAMAVEGE